MKKIRRIIICGVVLINVLLCSCQKHNSHSEVSKISNFYQEYYDKVYLLADNRTNLVCLDGENLTVTNACYNPMCTHNTSECSLYIDKLINYSQIAIDEYNNGIFAVISARDDEYGVISKIIRYDIKMGKKTVILDRWETTIGKIVLWNDYIFFNTRGKDGEFQIYRMNSDGSNLNLMDSIWGVTTLAYRGFYKGYLYIENTDEQTLYKTDVDFSIFEKVEFKNIDNEDIANYSRIHNGYLYYYCYEDILVKDEVYSPKFDWGIMDYTECFKYYNGIMLRVKLDDPNATPEVVTDMTTGGQPYFCKNKIYVVDTKHLVVGMREKKDQCDILRPTYHTNYYCGIKVIDVDTNNEEIIFEKSNYSVNAILIASDDYVVFSGVDEKLKFDTGTAKERQYVFNRITGEFDLLY